VLAEAFARKTRIDVVVDDECSLLRELRVSAGCGIADVAEAVCAEDDAGVRDDAIADGRAGVDDYARIDAAVLADAHARAGAAVVLLEHDRPARGRREGQRLVHVADRASGRRRDPELGGGALRLEFGDRGRVLRGCAERATQRGRRVRGNLREPPGGVEAGDAVQEAQSLELSILETLGEEALRYFPRA